MESNYENKIYSNATLRILSSEDLQSSDYQRPLNMQKVRKIVREFDRNKVNPPQVSHRDGKFYVFNGAHTLAAIKIIKEGKPFKIHCLVYEGLTREQEASLFASQYDNASKVGFNYMLNAKIIAGDVESIRFKEYTEGVCVRLMKPTGNSRVKNTIAAVERAWKIYNKYGARLYVETLTLIKETWGGESWSYCEQILAGVSKLLTVYPNIDKASFAEKVGQLDIATMKRQAKMYMTTNDKAFAMVFATEYNKNKKNRLDISKLVN